MTLAYSVRYSLNGHINPNAPAITKMVKLVLMTSSAPTHIFVGSRLVKIEHSTQNGVWKSIVRTKTLNLVGLA